MDTDIKQPIATANTMSELNSICKDLLFPLKLIWNDGFIFLENEDTVSGIKIL
jgi:hypothetical protein